MTEGRIIKALSGFWYVDTPMGLLECRARGRFRLDGVVPLVGDIAEVEALGGGRGSLTALKPRKNTFVRPAVANLDCLVILASRSAPVTDLYLIDRMIAIAELKGCDPVICFNKCDIERAAEEIRLYTDAGFHALGTSTETGEGIEELKRLLHGKLCAFTGNSGVGKSSLLNALKPELDLKTGAVSAALGRGRHTTRHVELFALEGGILAADTPGFASFDTGDVSLALKHSLAEQFREFRPFLGLCRYTDCGHTCDRGCAVLEAVEAGKISQSRHNSYIRLRNELMKLDDWAEQKKETN